MTTIKKIGAILLVIVIIGLTIKVGSTAPDYAVVYVDPQDGSYFPEIYLPQDDVRFRKTTLKEARDQNLEIKDGMNDFYAQRNLLFEMLRVPVWVQRRSGFHFQERWNNDGTWNW